jgi:5-oxoprolinase (ATP-hydrolysing) subunit C
MSRASIEVTSAGALTSVQDLGRVGWRRLGVPRAGALDPTALRIANALAGNDAAHAALEFFVAGPTLKALDAPVRLGLAGDFTPTLVRAGGQTQQLDAWRSVTLAPGDALKLGAPRASRVGYVAIAGLTVTSVLGSASTYLRAQLGANGGRALRDGDRLHAAVARSPEPGRHPTERWLRVLPVPSMAPIRVVLGPQADYFDADAVDALFGREWRVSSDADRMGMRLQGTPLAHRRDQGAEIVSDATVPGSVQVPGNGLPIVLLADGQTAGGYPKIATVISTDLPRLACAPIGATLRFAAVSVADAEDAAREHEARVQAMIASIRELAFDGDIDLDAIYASNLVSGMIDACNST